MRKEAGVIDVVIGPPLDPTGRTAAALMSEVETWIEARCAELPLTAGREGSIPG